MPAWWLLAGLFAALGMSSEESDALARRVADYHDCDDVARSGGGVATFLEVSRRCHFTLRAEAALPDGTRFTREAIVRLTGRKDLAYVVERWC